MIVHKGQFYVCQKTSNKPLEVSTSYPFVHNVDHVLSGDGSVSDERNDSKHSQTSVDHFSFLGKTKLECWQVTERLVVASFGGFIVWVVRVKKKGVVEGKRADGGHKRDGKEMGVGNEDDGPLVGDGFLSGNGGERSPFRKVEGHVGIRDQSVSFGVRSAHDEEPSEHGVTAVPLFGVNGGSPSVLDKARKLFRPVGLGIVVHLGVHNVQRRCAKRGEKDRQNELSVKEYVGLQKRFHRRLHCWVDTRKRSKRHVGYLIFVFPSYPYSPESS